MSEAPKTVWPSDEQYAAIRRSATQAFKEIASDYEDLIDMGGVNWAHLNVVEVTYCRDEQGECRWRVLIEEASPDSKLAGCVYRRLAPAHPTELFDVVTEW